MVGARLRRLRTARGLTQRQLAEPRYTAAYVSTIESGRRRPSRAALEHFAARLGVDPEELASGRPRDLEVRLGLRLQEARVALSGGRAEEAARGFRVVSREARRFGLTRLQAEAEEGMGLYLERAGKPEEALERYQRAEEVLRDEPPTARAGAVAGKARCFQALGDVRYAVFLLESLIEAIEREGVGDPDPLARLHATLVGAYLDAGLPRRAARSAAELDRLAPRLAGGPRLAQLHMNVARLYLYQGRVEEAERSLRRAEDLYREASLESERGAAHLARGYVLSREGRLAEAREELERAREVFEETGDAIDLVRAQNELARVARQEGRIDRARELLERTVAMGGAGDTPILAWAHRELGLLLTEAEPAVAEKHLRQAVELYRRSEEPLELAVTYRALGDLLGAQGDAAGSCEAYRTGILALEPHL